MNRLRPGIAPKNVETRASGRPPEESQSDNPEERAQANLEESEDRTIEGAERSAEDEA